jgi:ABC-2 type transport system permease protein
VSTRGASLTIAAKDLRLLWTRRSVGLSIIALPLLAAVGLPQVLRYAADKAGSELTPAVLEPLLDAFLFFFTIAAGVLPTAIASYSIVGEKIERSLEPLLATPVTDLQILLGKALAAVLPPVLAIEAGAVLFMVLSDPVARERLGHSYFPNPTMWLILLVVVPLSAVLAVAFDVIVSARVNDVRTAQQLGALAVVPFAAVYLLLELRVLTLTTTMLWQMAGVLVVLDLALLAAARATFRREEILTRWR